MFNKPNIKLLSITVICIFYFSFCNLHLFAQTNIYHPFPDSNAVWRVDWGQNTCNYPAASYQYQLTTDTIVGTYTYKKIFKTGTTYFLSCASNYYGYIGAIRQDTTQKKVFFLPEGKTSDTLLYDFSLKVGDTLPATFNLVNPNTIVSSIDSILIGTKYRRRLNLSEFGCISPGFISLIEGIGSTTGLLEELCAFEAGGNLVCFQQNGQTLYPNTNTVCDTITSIADQLISENIIHIYPNPNDGQFTLTVNKDKGTKTKEEVAVYDILGNIVFQKAINQSTLVDINLSMQANGVYFLHYKSDTHQLIKKIIIIK